jgi:hypothetical protein
MGRRVVMEMEIVVNIPGIHVPRINFARNRGMIPISAIPAVGLAANLHRVGAMQAVEEPVPVTRILRFAVLRLALCVATE